MRIPIPIALLLIIALVSGVWWHGTHGLDFMIPPNQEELQKIRTLTESSFPRTEETDDAISQPVIAEPEKPVTAEPVKPKPEIDPGDLTNTPTLAQFGDRAPQGAPALVDLAKFLEAQGQFQRALLAWERVIDLSQPDAAQATSAITAIRRLRPTLPDWNLDSSKAIPVTLQAGVSKKMTKTVAPELEKVAHEMERAASGMIKVTTLVTLGKASETAKGTNPAPVAIWITGAGKKSVSTDVISFTSDSPETLHDEISKSVFTLIISYIRRATSYTQPAPLSERENAQDALTFRITRLCWHEVASLLNIQPPPKPEEPPAKKKSLPVEKSRRKKP